MGPQRRNRDRSARDQAKAVDASRVERVLAVGTLAAGIVHQFNNVLAVVLGYASSMLQNERVSPKVAEGLNKIIEAAEAGRRLTEEVGAYLSDEVAPCSVHRILSSIVALLAVRTGPGISLQTQFEAECDAVRAPAGLLRQILLNVLANLLDCVPPGGRLSVCTRNVRGNGKNQGSLWLEVVVAEQDHQGHSALRGEEEEWSRTQELVTGLPDAVMRVEDDERGGRVILRFPAHAVVPDVAEPPRATSARPIEVWVVDDNATFCEMCQRVLGDAGHRVAVMDTAEALEKRWSAATNHPNAIILDFSMPDRNGLQICQWLRSQGPEVPIILVSGLPASHPDIRQALQMPNVRFLQKPFTVSELTQALRNSL